MSKPITVPGGTILPVRGKWLACRWGDSVKTSHKSREDAVRFLATKQVREDKRMARKVVVKKKTATKAAAKPARTRAAAKAKKAAPQKRERAQHDNEALRKKVRTMRGKATPDTWAEIAEALHVTPGKAQFLNMLNEIEDNPKLRIKFRNDEELQAKIVAAREKADKYSSWGWIWARTGVPEPRVKALAEEAGLAVKGANIASERAGNEPAPKVKGKRKVSAKRTTTKRGAKAKAANPSK